MVKKHFGSNNSSFSKFDKTFWKFAQVLREPFSSDTNLVLGSMQQDFWLISNVILEEARAETASLRVVTIEGSLCLKWH